MERRRRRPQQGRRKWRPALLAAVAVLTVVSAVLWLATDGPLGARDTADGSAATVTSAASANVAPLTATSAGAITMSPPVKSPSPSPSASHSASASPSPSRHATSAPATTTTSQAAATTASAANAPAGDRLITIVNDWNETIWAATNPNAQYAIPVTGWELQPGQSVTFAVNQHWGGRVWGRTGCSFNSAGNGHCASGDCGGVFQCQGSEGGPTTLAELTLDAWDGMDFYDVSMVDGANLPMYINTTHRQGTDPISSNGCYQGQCTTAVNCPSAMQVKADGQTVACEPACSAFGGDAYCCTGAWAGRQNCDPAKWPVDYAKLVFKDAEPYAYSYAFDDSATMSCSGGCNYRITFGITP
jgi:hypothetical protein